MSSEARVMPMTPAAQLPEKRRGRRPADPKNNRPIAHFFLAEPSSDAGVLVLKEKFDSEGHAVVASLTRGQPYYRVEVWQSRAVVSDGAVTVEKLPVKDGG